MQNAQQNHDYVMFTKGGEIPPTCMSEERERGRGKRNKERAGGKKGRAGKCGVGQKQFCRG